MKVRAGDIADLGPAFARRDQAQVDSYPQDNVADLQTAGVFGAPFGPALGGAGWDTLESTMAVEELAAWSPSTALLAAMPLGLAGAFASDDGVVPGDYRGRWLDEQQWLAGQYVAHHIFAACNSEKGAGGSLDATKAVARRDDDGRFRVSGEKILASFGEHADYFFSTAKVDPAEVPGCGVVEFFFVRTDAEGVDILGDWDGFGMRATESHTVVYRDAVAERMAGYPDFIATMQPLTYWFCLFAAIPLGCARSLLRAVGEPEPVSPALRLRVSEAVMRYEALRAYLRETAREWRPGAGAEYAARVLRTKTYVTQEATKLCAELFALSGGRHYRRTSPVARTFADSFAGTALRPPLPLGLEQLTEQFSLGAAGTAQEPAAI